MVVVSGGGGELWCVVVSGGGGELWWWVVLVQQLQVQIMK